MYKSTLSTATIFTIIVSLSNALYGFGKNKVQFVDLQWNALQTTHFNIFFHQEQGPLPGIASSWIETDFHALKTVFRFSPKDRIPLVLYGTPNLFTQSNIITELLPEGVGGFTELIKTRIAIPFSGSYPELRHVLHHELVHAFVFGMLHDKKNSARLLPNNQTPLWFMEGVAEYLSCNWDSDADMFMVDRTLNSTIPIPGPALNGYMAYKGGQSFLHFLAVSRGDSAFSALLLNLKKNKSVEKSLEKIYTKTLTELGKEWVFELRRLYWPEIGVRIKPSSHARALTNHLENLDHFNLRPRISPDGNQIAFFSDRNDYTSIIVVDSTGKKQQVISQNGYGGYFESFHPFRTGMCWSPDGDKIAFITKDNGADEIRIVDIKRKKLHDRIRTRFNTITSPDWSPDGSLLVFSAIDSGKGDLFTYNLSSRKLSQLTNSVTYEADPRFSPDGKTILFSLEDTCGTPPDGNTPYGSITSDLAIIECSTQKTRRLTTTVWSEKQPCFSPQGDSILFVCNINGIDNLYIAPLDSPAKAVAITNYTGGCSNPDWSRKNNNLVFSLFEQQGWNIWLMTDPEDNRITKSLKPTQWVASFSDTANSFFAHVPLNPPDTAKTDPKRTVKKPNKHSSSTKPSKIGIDTLQTDTISASPASPSSPALRRHPADTAKKHFGHPDTLPDTLQTRESDSAATVSTQRLDSLAITPGAKTCTANPDTFAISAPKPYHVTFSPDIVTFGLGMSTVYNPAGQIMIGLSDLLGDHRIVFAGDLQGNITDYTHLFASYTYLHNRINYGGGIFYNKDYSFASTFGYKLYHDMEYGGFLLAQYPFSMFSRVDFQILSRFIERKPLTFDGPTLHKNILIPSINYVFDNTLWGITGPLNGVRAQAELQYSPATSFTSDPYISFDADVRGYLHLFKRFVWANRVFAGISVPVGSTEAARRYLLGGNENWFLYQINVEQYEKNVANTYYSQFVTPFRGWNYLDITGTHVAVFNSEFRFPFIREITVVWPLPMQIRYINGALFTDIGNAWDAGEHSGNLPLPSKIYGGFGFGLRANLGIFLLRFDRGWPTDWRTYTGRPTNYFSLGAEF